MCLIPEITLPGRSGMRARMHVHTHIHAEEKPTQSEVDRLE